MPCKTRFTPEAIVPDSWWIWNVLVPDLFCHLHIPVLSCLWRFWIWNLKWELWIRKVLQCKKKSSRSRIDGDWWRLLVASSFSHRFRRRKLNVDVLHTLLEMTMARSKIWMILDRTGTNTWSDNMMGNNSVVSEWKENFKLPQPSPGLFFWRHFVSRCRGNKQLVDHFILNVPGVVVRISF